MARGVGLSRDKVIALARQIADGDGASALTLSTLAEAAGVRKPSLYKHVDGLPDLRNAITLQTYAEMAEVAASAVEPGGAPEDAVLRLAHAWRDYARHHRGSYEVASRTHVRGDAAVFESGARLMGVVLELLGGLGLEGPARVHAARAFRALIHGFVVLEAGDGFGLDINLEASFEAAVEALVRGWAAGGAGAQAARA